MRARTVVISGWLVVSLGCASSQSAGDAAPVAESGGPCTASVPGADVSGWRQVAGRGFTVCLPPEWRADGRGWRGESGRVEWAEIIEGQRRPYVASGSGMPSAPVIADRREFEETIGGEPARLWQSRFDEGYRVGVAWPRIRRAFTGEARDAGTVALIFTIYRTVRFSS